jgi:hypothetical protein
LHLAVWPNERARLAELLLIVQRLDFVAKLEVPPRPTRVRIVVRIYFIAHPLRKNFKASAMRASLQASAIKDAYQNVR